MDDAPPSGPGPSRPSGKWTPRRLVTLGLLIGSFMGSMEATVVATAMPTIVGQLGGLSVYGWAFSIYVLASSAGIPVTGRLSDLFGRRIVYAWSMALFLVASVLCALAPSMIWLIVFRGLQGLGAAGLLPLAVIMIGDMFHFEERAKVQGVFSGVWGISSIAGPLLGGLLVDTLGWPSVFYVNLPFGLLSAWMVWHWWTDHHELATGKAHIDYAGAAAVTGAAIALLLALVDITSLRGLFLGAAAAGLAWVAYRVEQRSPDPIIPLELFEWRLFTVAVLNSLVVGWLLNAVTAYVPLYVQEVRHTTATEAGAVVTPLLLAWVVSSVFCAKLMLRTGYRGPALSGMVLISVGCLGLALVDDGTSRGMLLGVLGVIGVGFGFSVPAMLIAVQSSVSRQRMGAATSMIQFSRSMGGSIGVGVMGGILNWLAPRGGYAVAIPRSFFAAAVVMAAGVWITSLAPAIPPAEMSRRR